MARWQIGDHFTGSDVKLNRFLFFILFLCLLPSVTAAAEPSFRCAGAGAPSPMPGAGIQAKQVDVRNRGIPREGRVHAVTIFVAFAGEQATVPAYAADLFRPDLSGSLSHFYTAMSFGRLTLDL
jgi:hypothetical protein